MVGQITQLSLFEAQFSFLNNLIIHKNIKCDRWKIRRRKDSIIKKRGTFPRPSSTYKKSVKMFFFSLYQDKC